MSSRVSFVANVNAHTHTHQRQLLFDHRKRISCFFVSNFTALSASRGTIVPWRLLRLPNVFCRRMNVSCGLLPAFALITEKKKKAHPSEAVSVYQCTERNNNVIFTTSKICVVVAPEIPVKIRGVRSRVRCQLTALFHPLVFRTAFVSARNRAKVLFF